MFWRYYKSLQRSHRWYPFEAFEYFDVNMMNPRENKFKRKKNEDWRSLFRFNWGSTHFIRCIIDSGYNFDSWKSTKIIKSSIYQTFSFVFVFVSNFEPFCSNKTNDADLWNEKRMKQSAFGLIWRDILTVMNFFPDYNSFLSTRKKNWNHHEMCKITLLEW